MINYKSSINLIITKFRWSNDFFHLRFQFKVDRRFKSINNWLIAVNVLYVYNYRNDQFWESSKFWLENKFYSNWSFPPFILIEIQIHSHSSFISYLLYSILFQFLLIFHSRLTQKINQSSHQNLGKTIQQFTLKMNKL